MLNRHRLRVRALEILYSLVSIESEKEELYEKQLRYSLEKLYDLYLLLLNLLVDFHHESLLEREDARKKFLATKLDLLPETALTRNIVLRKISESAEFINLCQRRGVNWSKHPEVPMRFFRNVKSTSVYTEYIESDKNSGKTDKAFILKMVEEVLLPDSNFISILEDWNIFWGNDIPTALGMFTRTIENIKVHGPLELIPELLPGDEDYDFALNLGIIAIRKKDIFEKYLFRLLKNWEPDRVSPIDMVLLRLGASELHAFPTIPINVTINEYIEISKEFSTSKSTVFLNGILDNMARIMLNEGMIKKTGRGLVQNPDKILN